MSMAVAVDPGHPDARSGAGEAGPASKRIVVAYGFWIFLLSDIVMFSALFATYAVLVHATAGGPTGAELFNQTSVAIETACLLALKLHLRTDVAGDQCAKTRIGTYLGAAVTFVLGAAFLALELHEFAGMIASGATPERSAFLSAFFTLVGCHGLHVTVGLLWLTVMMAQVATKGFRATVQRRLLCFSLFWHALDIIWVWTVHRRLSDGNRADEHLWKTIAHPATASYPTKRTGDMSGCSSTRIGLVLAVILTATSFWAANTSLLWAPGIPLGLAVLAIAQMGVHLVFFLHITTGPDNTNNVLALAFGMLIVFLVVAGSIWIMANLNANMMPTGDLMNLHMQH